jgi:hypothetical protein
MGIVRDRGLGGEYVCGEDCVCHHWPDRGSPLAAIVHRMRHRPSSSLRHTFTLGRRNDTRVAAKV